MEWACSALSLASDPDSRKPDGTSVALLAFLARAGALGLDLRAYSNDDMIHGCFYSVQARTDKSAQSGGSQSLWKDRLQTGASTPQKVILPMIPIALISKDEGRQAGAVSM